MKISLNEKGFIVATSETMTESIKLQEMFVGIEKPKLGRPVGSFKFKGGNWQTHKVNAWSRKHKKECEFCGKSYKNVRLHQLTKHPVEYKQKYGDTILAGVPVDTVVSKPRGFFVNQN